MSEAQPYLALPHFLKGFALNQFKSARDTTTYANGGDTCWPEAVQYLHRLYTSSSAIQEAMHDLQGIQQLEGEDGCDYCNRLDDACSRAGNVFSLDEKCAMFEAGLSPDMRSLISRSWGKSWFSSLELVHFAGLMVLHTVLAPSPGVNIYPF